MVNFDRFLDTTEKSISTYHRKRDVFSQEDYQSIKLARFLSYVNDIPLISINRINILRFALKKDDNAYRTIANIIMFLYKHNLLDSIRTVHYDHSISLILIIDNKGFSNLTIELDVVVGVKI